MAVKTHPQARSSSAKARSTRARSLSSSRPFTVAGLVTALLFLGIIMTATAVLLVFTGPGVPNPVSISLIFSGLGFCIVTWLIAFFKRRAAKCPLCKGTPLINSGALPHSRAKRIYPLNHGISAVISVLATQKFRCMYCGSDYDLRKISSHLRKPTEKSHS